MDRIVIRTSGSVSEIIIGAEWKSYIQHLDKKDIVIITDKNVFDIYGSSFPEGPVLIIKPGEESKTMRSAEKLASGLLKAGTGRAGFILAVGGGVVSDLAGFVASVYMRGIRVGYVSTTLLSQVDASTGGKTGVNLGRIKNVIGTFRQPEFVICDTSLLKTLTEDEYLSGIGELIKTGLIGDASIIGILEEKRDDVLRRDTDLLNHLIATAVRFKASVVAEDETEKGARRILNFGHTFGHAIELMKSVRHGIAVAEGIRLATLFSENRRYINAETRIRILNLLDKYRFPQGSVIPVNAMKKLITHDKKMTGSDILFVFLESIGKALVKKLPVGEVTGFYKQITADKQ